MEREVTLSLPEHVLRRAERLAVLAGEDVDTILAMTLGRTLPPLPNEFDEVDFAQLSDIEVLSLADSMMDITLSDRMSALHEKQQAESLSGEERAELQLLMEVFSAGQLRKTQALVEAVQRGLRSISPK